MLARGTKKCATLLVHHDEHMLVILLNLELLGKRMWGLATLWRMAKCHRLRWTAPAGVTGAGALPHRLGHQHATGAAAVICPGGKTERENDALEEDRMASTSVGGM